MKQLKRFTRIAAVVVALGSMPACCWTECRKYRESLNLDRLNADSLGAHFLPNDPTTLQASVVKVQLLSPLGVNNNPVDDELWVSLNGQVRFTFRYPSTSAGKTGDLHVSDLPKGQLSVVKVGFKDLGGNEGHFHAAFSGLLFGQSVTARETRTEGAFLPGKYGIVYGYDLTYKEAKFYRSNVDPPTNCDCK